MENENNDLFNPNESSESTTHVDAQYGNESISTIAGLDHVRLRPGMYIGKLGDGSHADDGIYVLIKEVVDNAIDEFRAGYGKQIEVTREERTITVRDYGRGIPLGKLVDSVSIMNTSGKFNENSYKKSVGLNGVGTKAANALSTSFVAQSVREGKMRRAEFSVGKLLSDTGEIDNSENLPDGTMIQFTPDDKLFENYSFNDDYIEDMLRNYSYLNVGLALFYQGKKFSSRYGLVDLLKHNMDDENPPLYDIIHLKGPDMEIAITHCSQSREDYTSFVNGQHTRDGGTHQSAFREAVGRTIKEFYNKNLELADIRAGIVAAIAVGISSPTFESQTKTKLGSTYINPDEKDDSKKITVNKFVNDFVKQELDNYLHKNPETAEILQKRISDAERERKLLAGVSKQAKERAKKISLHNDKLRDCRVHFNDSKATFVDVNDEEKVDLRDESSIFITEGLSASGSITKSRNVQTQAVFSLRGKPLNSFGKSRKLVYENAEFNLLQAALNIEAGLDGLRYNKVIIATDADVDGMHIRLLLLTFFLQFFPELVKNGHVFILQTPLFRVRDKKLNFYCYSEDERIKAINACNKKDIQITRFKGLGEISPDEFKEFIGSSIRLDPVSLRKDDAVMGLLKFYMGANTPERLDLVVNNLVVEEDPAYEEPQPKAKEKEKVEA